MAKRDSNKQTAAPKKTPPRRRFRLKQRLVGLAILVTVIVAAVLAVVHLMNRSHATATFMERVRAEKLITDVHEHIQSTKEADKMLASMDAAGIGRTALMGSSWFTMTLNPSVGFTKYDEINEQIMQICKEHPGRFEAWPTIDPLDANKLEKFKSLVERGAVGLKLYLGHGYVIKKTNTYMFHTMAIDDPRMFPVYRYCQENAIPVVLHVNPSDKTPGFAEEFVAVLNEFPDMKVVCPHWMLSSIKDSRLDEFLRTYPNLYTDVSFGHDDFMVPGLERISKNPSKFRSIIARYPNRLMFSTDLVVTNEPIKTEQWISERFNAYVDMLSKEEYTTPVIPNKKLRGLALSASELENIFYKNYEAFKALKPKGTKITHEFNWSRTGVTRVERKPGQSFPPPIL